MQVAPGVAIDLARRRTWAEVDLDAIAANVRAIRALLPESCRFMAVVKADGYGHGMTQAAKAAVEAGATWLGVATLDEGLVLRVAGFREPVLVLGALGSEDLVAASVPRPPLSVTIASPEMMEALLQTPVSGVRVHLKVDTGMTRLGVLPEDVPTMLDVLERIRPRVELEGCCTHLAAADDVDPSFTRRQLETFAPVAAAVRKRFPAAVIHTASSAGAIAFPESRYDMVRIGLSMYGIYPAPHLQPAVALQPAMRFLSRIVRVLRVPAGTPVSYGATYRTAGATTIATVACGYADGYPRQAGGRGQVVIRERRYPIAGRVNMDHLMVDVGDADVRMGDEVELFGTAVSADDLAAWAGSVSYQILCAVGPRVPRVFLRGGQPVDVRGPR
ncbi:MAG TPA: alanine racemase [bacterium]|jgi:alanine racemase